MRTWSKFVILALMLSGSTHFVVAKDKFLQPSHSREEVSSSQVVALAVRLGREAETKKMQREQVRAEKVRAASKDEMNKSIDKKKQVRDKNLKKLVLRARALEKKRRLRYMSWRNYLDNRRAAKYLLDEVKQIDRSNSLHVKELRAEISEFSMNRLKGRLYRYSELNDFMTS